LFGLANVDSTTIVALVNIRANVNLLSNLLLLAVGLLLPGYRQII